MSEVKRLELTTVSTNQKEKKVKLKVKTHRFALILGDSNATTCPEYSFADLIKNERPSNGDPFNDVDEDKEVAAIAQRFEAKYGPRGNQSGKRKRTQNMDDYCDLGDGYEEDDSFIDNTEAYDEVIPCTLTTQHGGFYINQGKLDFKSVEEDSLDEFNSPKGMKKKKKKVLESDSEEETPEALQKKFKAMKRKKLLESKEMEKKRKKISNGEEGEPVIKKKKKKNLDKLKMKKLLMQTDAPSQKDLPSAATVPTISTITPATTTTTGPSDKTSATMTNGSSDVKIDVAKKDVEDIDVDVFNPSPQDTMKDDSSSKSGEESKVDSQSSEKNAQLPSQLPPELLDVIESIKKEAKESKEGKTKFFTANINKLLLDIELGSRNLPWGSRTAVYNHLGEHLPCGKNTLLRRAKKLRESQQDDVLKAPLQELKEEIMKVMPSLQQQHELDVQKAKMEAAMNEESADATKEEASTESEGEEKSDNKKKQARGPRRKFQWNPHMRKLLHNIVATKMKQYPACKLRNQTAEEFLKAFLDSEVRPLWPQGWMQTRMLFKESRAAHEDITKPQQAKQRKPSATSDIAVASPVIGSISTPDISRSHISLVEDVIEVSSHMEDDDDVKETVVVNLSSSDIKPTPLLSSSTSASQSSVPTSSTTAGKANKQTFNKSSIPNTSVSLLSSPITSTLPQKSNDAVSNSSVKRVTPIPVTAGSPTPTSVQRMTVTTTPTSGQRMTITTKPFTPGSAPVATSTPLGPSGSSQSVLSSSVTKNIPNYYEMADGYRSHPQTKPSPSFTTSSQQQAKPSSIQSPNLQQPKFDSFHQQKVSVLQQKSTSQQQMAFLQQQKPTQEQQKQATLQAMKAAGKLSPHVVLNKDIPNASWTKVSSVVPSSKSTNQLNPTVMLQAQRMKVQNLADFKSHQTFPQKKRQQPVQLQPPHENMAAKVTMSSKKEPQNKILFQSSQSSQRQNFSPGSQIKSGIVVGPPGSIQRAGQQQQLSPHLKTGIVLGTSGALSPQLTGGAASDFAGWSPSGSSGVMKQPSPPGTRIPPVTQDRSSPLIAAKTSGLLNSNPATSLSRGSTPSPQKSPLSPGGNLSIYEKIESQIRNQEAMEGLALKNLALALNYGTGPGTGISGRKPATVDLSGKTSNVTSVCSGHVNTVNETKTQSADTPSVSTSTVQNVHRSQLKEARDYVPQFGEERSGPAARKSLAQEFVKKMSEDVPKSLSATPKQTAASLGDRALKLQTVGQESLHKRMPESQSDPRSFLAKPGQIPTSTGDGNSSVLYNLKEQPNYKTFQQGKCVLEKSRFNPGGSTHGIGNKGYDGAKIQMAQEFQREAALAGQVQDGEALKQSRVSSVGDERKPQLFSTAKNMDPLASDNNKKMPAEFISQSSLSGGRTGTLQSLYGASRNVNSSQGPSPLSGHKNIFSAMEKSFLGQTLAASQTKPSQHSGPEPAVKTALQGTRVETNSPTGSSKPTWSVPLGQQRKPSSSQQHDLEKACQSFNLASGRPNISTTKMNTTTSNSPASFQESFSNYAYQLLQDLIPNQPSAQSSSRQSLQEQMKFLASEKQGKEVSEA